MLICWGSAWPFSIYTMIRTKKAHGKSVPFIIVILTGYIAGMLFQYFGERSPVIYLYLFNTALVIFDLFLTLKYRNEGNGGVAARTG